VTAVVWNVHHCLSELIYTRFLHKFLKFIPTFCGQIPTFFLLFSCFFLELIPIFFLLFHEKPLSCLHICLATLADSHISMLGQSLYLYMTHKIWNMSCFQNQNKDRSIKNCKVWFNCINYCLLYPGWNALMFSMFIF
jgi:hypothetical protein